MQRERNRTRTIIPRIGEGAVTAAPNVWSIADRVYCPDRILHAVRRVRGRIGDTVAQHGTVSGTYRVRTTSHFRFSANIVFFAANDRLGAWNYARCIIGDLYRD